MKIKNATMSIKQYPRDGIIFNMPVLQHGNIACYLPMRKSCQWASGRKAACLPPPQLLSFDHAGPCGSEAEGTMAPVLYQQKELAGKVGRTGVKAEGSMGRGKKLWLKGGVCLHRRQSHNHASEVMEVSSHTLFSGCSCTRLGKNLTVRCF